MSGRCLIGCWSALYLLSRVGWRMCCRFRTRFLFLECWFGMTALGFLEVVLKDPISHLAPCRIEVWVGRFAAHGFAAAVEIFHWIR